LLQVIIKTCPFQSIKILNTNFSKTIQSLQLLRGIAVTLVIMVHTIDNSFIFGHSFIRSFFYMENFGDVGVDIFFVISGVIITVITATTPLPPGQFFVKRCIRILPMYWGASVFYYILSLAGFLPAVKNLEILETFTIIPVTRAALGPALSVGWTLAFEFLFYLVFTLALWINKKQAQNIVVTVLAVLVFTGYVLPATTDKRLLFITNPLILEFLLGCICGHIYLTKTKFSNRVNYGIIAAGTFLLLFTIFNGFSNINVPGKPYPVLCMLRVIQWGIPSFLLVTGMVMLEKNTPLKIPALLVAAGNSSYSAYLVHFFCIMIVTTLWRRAGIGLSDLFIVTTILFSQCIAYLVYKLIEKPFTHYLNKIYLRSKGL
jgi:exopolysaccharide production protein ExoZ